MYLETRPRYLNMTARDILQILQQPASQLKLAVAHGQHPSLRQTADGVQEAS